MATSKSTDFIRKFIHLPPETKDEGGSISTYSKPRFLGCGRPWLFFLVIFIGFSKIFASVSEAKPLIASQRGQTRGVTALAAYAVDYTNRKILFSRNVRMKFHPASTAKLLTALVVLDHKKLSDRVVVSRHAVSVMPSKADLTLGAACSVEDLLKVLLAASANDAAVALAEDVAGSESNFAVLMNKKAKSLGVRDSFFTNSTGLPDERQVTTAYDLTMIVRAALSQPFIASVMRQKSIRISGSDSKNIQKFNHNKLLWRVSYPCVLGKTGYTRAAGHCYAGIAMYNDRRVSVVILKSRKPWADLTYLLGITNRRQR